MDVDGTESVVAALFGMEGFRLLAAGEVAGELELLIETTAELVGCPECGAVARSKGRRPVWVRDLPIAGRPVVLCWHKRLWQCPHRLCPQRSWTEQDPDIGPRACLTERARQRAFERVGAHDAAVAHVAGEFGVDWHTVMRIVTDRGEPVVDTLAEGEDTTAVGVDETAFLSACARHPTRFATGIVDVSPDRPARLLDVVDGRSGAALTDWLARREAEWKTQIATASLDPYRGYANALTVQLPQAARVLDPFHVVKLSLSAVDDVRCRVQQQQTGHRGRSDDPLYRIRRVARRRADRLSEYAWQRLRAGLDAGDPTGELTIAWSIAQEVMGCYRSRDVDAAEQLIDTARTCPVPEVARLGRTLAGWRDEFLAAFTHTATSNGPTEALNTKIKNTKRIARGFRNFNNYRLRLLLNHGRIHQNRLTSRIRSRVPA